MSSPTPLLSICIPTRNRAEALRRTLASICAQEVFDATGAVEVVVSDNASDDATAEVVREFIQRHGDKVRYFRNAQNIHDRNFEVALARGRGALLKLNNDTLEHLPGSLRTLLEIEARHRGARPVLFFLHQGGAGVRCLDCATMDAFVGEVSYNITWIAGFSIWREDFAGMADFGRCAPLQLQQVDAVLRQLGGGRHALVVRAPLWRVSPGRGAGGYDLLRVFMDNYFGLLAPYVARAALSRGAYEREKRRMLHGHIARWVAMSKVGCQASFDVRDHGAYVRRHFDAAPWTRLVYRLLLAGNLVKYGIKRLVLDNRERLRRARWWEGRS